MSTSTTEPYIVYNGNGATSTFAIPFSFIDGTEIKVEVLNTTTKEVELQVNPTDYTVVDNNVEFEVASIPASGTKIYLTLNMPYSQTTDYQDNDSFAAESHEAALDTLTRQVKQIKTTIERNVVRFGTNDLASTEIPDGLIAANKLIATNDDATGITLIDAASGGGLLGTMSSQDSDDVDITGGAISGTSITSSSVSITGGTITGITDLALADGGTGATLADPGADRIMFWDDSAGAVTWLTAGTGLTITGTTMTASASAPAIDDLTDVTITSLLDNQILSYDSGTSQWINVTPDAGSIIAELDDIPDVTITAVTDNEVLAYDSGSSTWINQTAAEAGLSAVGHTHTLANITDAGTIASQNSNSVSITGGTITGITDLALADGGTGATLADPGADRIMFWDDSAGAVTWLTAGTGLTITGTTMTASGSGSISPNFIFGKSTSISTYRLPNFALSGTVNAALVANRIEMVPMSFGEDSSFTRLGAQVTVAVADSTIRLGIYNADGTNGLPGTLVVDAGTVSGASTAAVEATISETLNGNYWLCCISGHGPSLRATQDVGLTAAIGAVAATNAALPKLVKTAVSSWHTALPADVSGDTFSIASADGNYQKILWLRDI